MSDPRPVSTWMLTRHGDKIRLLNVVKACDLPVDDSMCFDDVQLDGLWGAPAATLQFAVEARWEDAVAYVEPRLPHALARMPSPLTVIFSDGTRNRETTQSYLISDALKRDFPRALGALTETANAGTRGVFIWDRALLQWRHQVDNGGGANSRYPLIPAPPHVQGGGEPGGAGVRSPIVPAPPDLQGGAEAVAEEP